MKNPETLIWERVHFKWYHKGCNWILRKIEWDQAICITPKTRKEFIWNIQDIYPTNKNLKLNQKLWKQ